MIDYDVVILGGGTGGSAAAKAAYQAGAKVVMFNQDELGGLCILRGCMPTKTMLHAAHLAHEAAHHKTPGVGRGSPEIDFTAIMANKDAKVARFQKAKIGAVESGGYDVVLERAVFSGPDTVEAGGKSYRFLKGAVIATGSVIAVPPIPGVEQVPYIDSDGVMELKEQPRSVVAIGSGAIGLELSQFFARMGTQVSLISRRPVFCDVDPLISKEIHAAFNSEPNFNLISPCTINRVAYQDNEIAVEVEVDGEKRIIRGEKLLFATGRKPNLDIGLKIVGVEVKRGRVPCGADMRTSNPRVFVAGDASGDKLLLHVANWEGAVAGRNAALEDSNEQVDHRLDMAVVFTDPPLATVGINVEQAKQQGIDIVSADTHFSKTGRAITQDVEYGVVKLVADKTNGEILGCQILGPRADDIIHIISAIMNYHGTAAQMLKLPWYHPTIAEVLLGLAREIEDKR